MPQINTFPVVDLELVQQARDVIARALIGERGIASGDAGLQISPTGGTLYYSDDDALWTNSRGGGLPANADAATAVAQRWLAASRKRLASGNLASLFDPQGLLPQGLEVSVAYPMFAPDAFAPDHWLVRFELALPTGLAQQPSALTDATFEIRIGSAGTIVGLSTSWRAVESSVREDLVEPTNPGVSLFYVVGSTHQPQAVISPYYLQPSDEGGMVWPASANTLLVTLGVSVDGPATSVVAVVVRGGDLAADNELDIHWAAWRIDDPGGDALNLGSGTTARMPGPGTYNVVADIEDRVGGRFERAELMVFAGPVAR